MSSYGLAKARYASDATQTVSPARLVTMLYDRLVGDLASAEEAMRCNDFATVGGRLGRAQEILLELHGTLDLVVWPEGEPLSRLYLWMVGELMQARLHAAPQRVADCRALLEPLRDAWYEAATGQPIGSGVAGSEVAGSEEAVPTPTTTSPGGPRARYVITSAGVA